MLSSFVKEEKRMKIMIAVPCYEAAPVEFCQCLINLLNYEKKLGKNELDVIFMGSSLIYEVRNQLALKAIACGCDYVLWIDSDMLFEPDALEQLLDNDKEFVCGQFFSRRPPFEPCVFSEAEIRVVDDGNAVIPYNVRIEEFPSQLFEIAACGFAFTLTKTESLAAVMSEAGLPFQPCGGFGEDLSFCVRARDAGFKLFCDPACKIGHLGKMVVNEGSYHSYAMRGE